MYQPKIRDENIRRLYRLKLQKKKPMTQLLDQIINDYFESQKEKVELKDAKNITVDAEQKYCRQVSEL